jgi:hypothetical protein
VSLGPACPLCGLTRVSCHVFHLTRLSRYIDFLARFSSLRALRSLAAIPICHRSSRGKRESIRANDTQGQGSQIRPSLDVFRRTRGGPISHTGSNPARFNKKGTLAIFSAEVFVPTLAYGYAFLL